MIVSCLSLYHGMIIHVFMRMCDVMFLGLLLIALYRIEVELLFNFV